MIVLSQTTDSLKVTATGGIPLVVSWRDRSSTTFIAGKSVLSATGSSEVTLVTGPESSYQRIIDFISLYNDSENSIPVSFKVDSSSGSSIVYNGTAGPYQGIQYAEKQGFFQLDPSGAKFSIIENSVFPISNPWTNVFLTDTFFSNRPAPIYNSVTGLSFYGETGASYYFCWRFVVNVDSASTGTFASVTGPGPQSPPFLAYVTEFPNSSDGISRSVYGATYGTPTDGINITWNNISGNGSLYATFMTLEGLITLDSSTSGDIIPQVSFEALANAFIRILPGSYLEYQKLS